MSDPLPATVPVHSASALHPDEHTPGARPRFIASVPALAMVALCLLAAGFLFVNRAELPSALRAARHAHPLFLALALVLTLGYLAAYGALHWASLRAVNVSLRYPAVLKAAVAAHFLNLVVVNSGGMGGLPLMVRQVERRGGSRANAAVAYLISSQLGHFLFGAVLLLALVVAQADGQATVSEWIAAGIFAAFSAISLLLLIAAIRSRDAVRALYSLPWRIRCRLSRLVGRAGPARPALTGADELREAALLAVTSPAVLLLPALFAVVLEVLGVATLWTTLRSFGVPVGLDVPLVAYAVGVLFGIVGFLPAGLGFAEAGLGVALSAAGVPGPQAALTVVTYRVFEVWLPFGLGLLAMRLAWRRTT